MINVLAEAAQAADLRCGCLLDHKDLRLTVGRLVTIVEELLKQNDELKERLSRGSHALAGGSYGVPVPPPEAARHAPAYRH